MVNKYRNIKRNGFDSRKEERRWRELQALQRIGRVKELRRQVKYQLIPAQYIDGECVFRAVNYYADFVYRQNGMEIVEDCKSPVTRKDKVYIIKKKLMYSVHGILIYET